MRNRHGMPPDLRPECAPISMLMRHVCHAHDFAVRSRLEEIGVTMAFGPVFRALHRCDGLTQTELAQALNFRASSISVTLRQMEELGYIEKRQSDEDARNVHIYLTERGKGLETQIKQTFDRLDSDFVSPLSSEEKDCLRNLLVKIYNDQMRGNVYEKEN